MVEAEGLKKYGARSPSLSSSPYKISCMSTGQFKSIRGFPCTHRRSLNVHYFGMVEATGLKSVVSRSPPMASPAYQVS
jgi:hypothetical protein